MTAPLPAPVSPPANPRDIDKTRWPRLSLLLDELLELPPPQREPRLQTLAADDPELALDLRELLRREQALAQTDFLAQPAPLGPLPGSQQPGQRVGVYTLDQLLGQGGMGSVWLASRTDGRYQGQVAIKFLTSGLLGQGDAGRFAREGQILARLAHPNIARLLDAGLSTDSQQPYLVLEYVQGLPIDQHCRLQGLDLRQRVSLMLEVLAAVAHAHHRLILHRDLKPSNILVTPEGQAKLLDFGIAKLLAGERPAAEGADTAGATAAAAATGAAAGAGAAAATGAGARADAADTAADTVAEAAAASATDNAGPSAPHAAATAAPPATQALSTAQPTPHPTAQPPAPLLTELTQRAGNAYTPQYAAPEQVQGGEVTMATDVYALGVLLYQLLTGAHPADAHTRQHGDTPLERLRALVEVDPPRPSELLRQRAAELRRQASAAPPTAAAAASEPARLQRQARELRGDLDTIVAKALKKVPGQRYPQADALADDLRRWLHHQPISARPDTAAYRIAKLMHRHPWGVGVSALAVLALSGLTALSLAQAHRAERAEQLALQRSAQADDLLGYMLGEFADKLRPLGRLELLAGVGSKALAHLGAAPEASASPASRLQRAKALTVLGEVSVAKRELAAATEPLQAARRLLTEQPPAGADAALAKDWRIAQGAAAFWLGEVSRLQRNHPAAQSAWEDYRRYSQAVLEGAPDDLDAQLELSYALNSLGTLMLDTQQLAAASTYFEQSLALKAQVIQSRPRDMSLRSDWADSLFWLAQTWRSQGRFREVQALLARGMAGVQAVRAMAPADLMWVQQEAAAHLMLAKVSTDIHDVAVAGEELRLALNLMQPLLRQQPDNRRWWLFNIGMKTLEARLAVLGSHQAINLLQGVIDQLLALNQGRSGSKFVGLEKYADAVRELLPHLLASGLVDQARALVADALGRLDQSASDGSAWWLNDLRLRLRLIQADRRLVNPPERARLCRAIWDDLKPSRPLLQSDYQFTAIWVETMDCLGREDEARAARNWLQARNSGVN